jgi:hypothetical protein
MFQKSEYEFQLALSFAGEDRQYAEELNRLLVERNVRVFYDFDQQSNLLGENLYHYLQEIYKNKSQFCVIFVSEFYRKKLWTNHELEQAQARAFSEPGYIIPICLDDTKLPGINDTTGYFNLKSKRIDDLKELADLLANKLRNLSVNENHLDSRFEVKKEILKENWVGYLRKIFISRFDLPSELLNMVMDEFPTQDFRKLKLIDNDPDKLVREVIDTAQRKDLQQKMVNWIRSNRPDIKDL